MQTVCETGAVPLEHSHRLMQSDARRRETAAGRRQVGMTQHAAHVMPHCEALPANSDRQQPLQRLRKRHRRTIFVILTVGDVSFRVMPCPRLSSRVALSTGGHKLAACARAGGHGMQPPVTGPTRRRHPRIEIDGGHGARDLTDGQPVRIRDISSGGFQTEGPLGTAPGTTHTFRVVLRDGPPCVVRATAVHSRPAPGGGPTCIVGWQAATDPVTTTSMQQLIEEVTTIDMAGASHA